MLSEQLKKSYRRIIEKSERSPERIRLLKTRIAEDFAIFRKRPFYKAVEWTKKQQNEFDEYWLYVYGKRIPNKWNRLYEAFNGVYRADYIPEKLYSLEIEPALNDFVYARVLEDKAVLESLCCGCGVKVPETVCVLSGGRFYDKDRFPVTQERALDLLSEANDVVLKPSVGGSSGFGIAFFENFSLLTQEEKKSALKNAGNEFIAQKRLKTAFEYSVFNPSSVNTVRVITYMLGESVYHVPLVLRMGRSGKNVDNIHSGGLSVGVSDDGTLLKEAFELNYGDKKTVFQKHPDSGVVFEGYKLPCMASIISAAKRLHGRFPHLGIISWDFAVDENKDVVLIEANIRGQSIWFPQMLHGKGAFEENTKAVFDEVKKRRRK